MTVKHIASYIQLVYFTWLSRLFQLPFIWMTFYLLAHNADGGALNLRKNYKEDAEGAVGYGSQTGMRAEQRRVGS